MGDTKKELLKQVFWDMNEPVWLRYPVDWCAIFVSWCANECGYIDAGVVPKFAGCVQRSR